MSTNDELEALYNAEQLRSNIESKEWKIHEFKTGLNVLRNSSTPDDSYILGRISHLEAKITDYEEAISDWRLLLAAIEKQP